MQYFSLKALANTDGWEISGAEVMGIDPVTGLKLKATGDVLTVTTPAFRCGTIVRKITAVARCGREISLPGPDWSGRRAQKRR